MVYSSLYGWDLISGKINIICWWSPDMFKQHLCHKWPRICCTFVNTSWSFPHSWLITRIVTRVTRRAPLVEQELLTLPEHLSSPMDFSGVRVTRSLVFLCVMFCRSLFVLSSFFFWPLHCLSFFDLRILITILVSYNSSS
jgi:hypothetical protein